MSKSESQAEERRLVVDCAMASCHLGEVLAELDAHGRELFLACIPSGLEHVRGALRDVFVTTLRLRSALEKAADAWGAEDTRDLGPVLSEDDTFIITPRGREALASLVPVSDQPKLGPDVINPTERNEVQRVLTGAASTVPAGEKCACGNLDGLGTHTPTTCRS